jgi:hypothetical protein
MHSGIIDALLVNKSIEYLLYQDIERNNQIICPTCRSVTESAAAALPHNITLIQLMDILNIGAEDGPPKCVKHSNKNVELYCESCGVFVCGDCVILDHPVSTHKCMIISDAVQKYKREINESIMKANETISELNNSLKICSQSIAVRYYLQALYIFCVIVCS